MTPSPTFKFRLEQAVQPQVMHYSERKGILWLWLVRTLLDTIYLLARSNSLTALPESWIQTFLSVCIGLHLPEILCKILSPIFQTLHWSKRLARQYLELPSIPFMLRLHAADNGTSSHLHWPQIPSSASGHTPPCNLNVQLLVQFFFSADNFFCLARTGFLSRKESPLLKYLS